MSLKTRKHYSGDFKAQVSMESLLQIKTTAEISSEYGVHTSQILKWKREFKENAGAVFDGDKAMESKLRSQEETMDQLYKQIGILTVERDFLKKKSGKFII